MNDTVRGLSCWEGCYGDGWQGEIVPEAFAHPAKVSRALIRRIYQHAIAEGWLASGDVVVDPFGGIAGTALDAMWNGLTWIGCELEPKFVALGGQNVEQWQRRYGAKAGFGSARIVQGDSRKLASVIGAADVVLSSPPFVTCRQDTTASAGGIASAREGDVSIGLHYGQNERNGVTEGQLGAMREGTAPALICSSPPYAAISTGAGGLNTKPGANGQQSGRSASSASQDTDQRYGETAGQLAVMREGEAPACVISSPPYAGSVNAEAHGIDWSKAGPATGNRKRGEGTKHEDTLRAQLSYGSAVGQLGSMPEGRFDAVVSSPPYEAGLGHGGVNNAMAEEKRLHAALNNNGYGGRPGNLSNNEGDTFWQAAHEIVAQCHAVLRPGGHAIFITKDFVRRGKRIPFSDQWQALCEAEGFRLVCRHSAMLVKRHGEQDNIFGGADQITTQRKSFFRRLAEKKGSPPIDFEDVICLERTA